MFKKITSFVFLLLLTVGLVACGNNQEGESEGSTDKATTDSANQTQVDISDEEKMESDAVVAVVNGEELLGNDYNTVYTQTKTLLQEQGQDVKDQEMVKEQALNALVSQKVLSQDAAAKGIEVTASDVDAYIEEAKAQFDSEEAFQTQLDNLNYTLESFREQVSMQLEQDAYVQQEFSNVEVTEEDVQAYYDTLTEQGNSDKLPALEDVKETIKTQLKNSQIQTKLNERIQALRDEAEIEKMI